MKDRENCIKKLLSYAILGFVTFWVPQILHAQTPAITATASQLNIQPNQIFTITFAVDSEVDAYYFGLEVLFNPEAFEFVGEFETGLMTGGITIADLLAVDRVGASVSLTAPLGAPASGNLLALTFRARQAATVGLSDFTISETELFDSNGLPIETLEPAPVSIQIDEGVSDLRLNIPAINQIVEGEELPVNGEVYVNDITVNESIESGRVTLWVGVNLTDTDPSGWGELAWNPMEFNAQQDSYHLYLQNVGFLLSPGTYYLALRAQLDAQPFVYGGRSDAGGGLWDGIENINAQLTITENPPFRYILAGWNFDDETLLASHAVPANEDAPFQMVDVNADGFSAGASGQAANATGWQFTEGDEKYWLAVISTQGFQNLTVSSRQYSTGSGPLDFELEAGLDGLIWETVSADTIKVATNWTSGVVDNLLLPASYEDQPVVYLRWIRRGDQRADGSGVITTGDNRIDDVYIRGENISPYEVSVWPGDTDNNGSVDELDVLPLGQYWLSAGPLPLYPGINWAARNVEAWIPEEGTYADATGDGTVDYRDLLPVGLNFGETEGLGKELSDADLAAPPIAELNIAELKAGDRVQISIETEEPIELTGISYRFTIRNIEPDSWKLVETGTGEWGKGWMDDDKMLNFVRQERGYSRAYATLVHKGKTDPETATELASFIIEATQDWNQSAEIVLERMIVTNNKSRITLDAAKLVSEGAIDGGSTDPDLPLQMQLRQNYPNPFNPTTVITYSLPNDGQASLVLYDMLGREVTTLLSGPQKAGTYDLQFDGSNLSSGIYIYRLQAEGKVLTRMLTLIK